jgi:hypothetical protein
MQPLAEPVLAAYHRDEFRIVPERWRATFEHWMGNIRDWNISRQLWWGHRIPVFTCTRCAHQWADREDPVDCPRCGGAVTQDPDVLDTWFSSWLWPFATFGWPEGTPDLARVYPGHTLVTAPEILFFWVARMLMSGVHFMGGLPFTTVYLTGTVRDTQHRKMSKSLGNGIDPRDVVQRYGTDALRWTLIGGGSLGADVIVDPNDLETTFTPGRNFANKLWNIGRFILAQLPPRVARVRDLAPSALTLADRWILSRLQATVREATRDLEQFRLDDAARVCFEFTWGQLADWYVEAVKPRLAAGDADAATAQAVLAECFDTALRLLHPVVPFITEELWQKLPGRAPDEMLVVAAWPAPDGRLDDSAADAEFAGAQGAIVAVRNIRAEYRVSPKTKLAVTLVPRSDAARRAFAAERDAITRLALASDVTVADAVAARAARAGWRRSGVHVALAGAATRAGMQAPLDRARTARPAARGPHDEARQRPVHGTRLPTRGPRAREGARLARPANGAGRQTQGARMRLTVGAALCATACANLALTESAAPGDRVDQPRFGCDRPRPQGRSRHPVRRGDRGGTRERWRVRHGAGGRWRQPGEPRAALPRRGPRERELAPLGDPREAAGGLAIQPGVSARAAPGDQRLRQNCTEEGVTLIFSTGRRPHGSLTGTAVLWAEQRSLADGLILAAPVPDTVGYLALVDSGGRFRLDGIPPGEYAVFAIQDGNGNRRRDRREAYDSALITVAPAATATLWAFVHDTVGPRLRQAEAVDSLHVRLTFTQALGVTRVLDVPGGGPDPAGFHASADPGRDHRRRVRLARRERARGVGFGPPGGRGFGRPRGR